MQPIQGIHWLLLLGLISLNTQLLTAQQGNPPLKWYKGNTHTHTLNSDGDSTPDDVVRWYREHGYNFLVLSDHNFLTSVDGLNAVHGAEEQFIVIRGEEVSDGFGGKPIHINGLNLQQLVPAQGGNSIVDVLQNNVTAIRNQDGVPHINHPNFGWAFGAEELTAVQGFRLLEIFNGHPRVNNLEGGGSPSVEQIWDQLLSAGKVIYGIAVDDAHHFKRPWDPEASLPGQGWVVVRADGLTPDSVLDALERGEFYASTGVEIEDYAISDASFRIAVKPYGQTKYRIRFIGEMGTVLLQAFDATANYTFDGNERYVRARVDDSNGKTAWLQPAFPGTKR